MTIEPLARIGLLRLTDALVEDILSTSDDEILAEVTASGGDPEGLAIEMRGMLQRAQRQAGR